MKCPTCDQELPVGGICPHCTLPSPSPPVVHPPRSPQGDAADVLAGRPSSSGSRTDGPEPGFAAGMLLAGRYRIVRLLGRGGMATVYHADDLTLEVPVALKFLDASTERDAHKLELFLNEVRLARQIAHENVCRVYDVGEVAGLHFLSMEYIDGENLASLLKRIGRLSKDRALQIGLEICSGLEAAHEREILHRDLKPANLMIDSNGVAHITDFGLASLAGSAPDDSGLIAGTPVYMAPEQMVGQISAQSDLYALGLVLYELFTGRMAFAKPQVFQRGAPDAPAPLEVEDLDPGVERAILSCLEADPHDRPRSAGEVAAAFERGAAPPWRPAAGAVIPMRNHWTLEERLGEGGFGEAWLAVHRKTREQRVFKFCHDAAKLRTFQREITIFRLLKGELGARDDISSLLDWSLEEPPYFIESEYTAGGNLKEWVEREGGWDGVPLDTRLEVIAQVATALAAAHSVGVMHKDVKPANVLIRNDPEGRPRARLADFGIGALTEVRRLEEAGITNLGLTDGKEGSSSYAGTRLYMAPELLEGKSATLQSDVYALGVLLYQMVVGDFSRALASGWDREVDDELLRQDISEAVEGSPDLRLGAARIAERLRSHPERREQLAADERIREEAELARVALVRTQKRRKWFAVALGVLLLLAGALAIAFEQGETTARRALIEQTLESHQGMARIGAASVDRNLAAVVRRLEREGGREELADLLRNVASGVDGRAPLQEFVDQLYQDYRGRHFYSWVVADRRAVAQARSPFDARVVGQRYDYREWFSGLEEQAADRSRTGDDPIEPRKGTGLTLAFRSTAEGNPILMSVATPILAPDDGTSPEVLGVLTATLPLAAFYEWLEGTEGRSSGQACPERFVLLTHRGQLLRHPCPDIGDPQAPVDRDGFFSTAPVQDLLSGGVSRGFRDPLRPGLPSSPADLAVAARLPSHPDWNLIVVQDRDAALRPLTRLTARLRRLGQLATAVGIVVLAALVGLLWHAGRQRS